MKKTSFERVVGGVSEEEKDKILKSREERFNDQFFKDLEGREREKTLEELQVIDIANKITNEIRSKYGLENFDIPPKNIHIIKESDWTDNNDGAFYGAMRQRIVIRENSIRINFATRIFHEMLHFKSYGALQVTTSEQPELDEYRIGLITNTRDGHGAHFSILNEAVTEEIVKKYTKEYINDLSKDPIFLQEISKTREIINKYPDTKKFSGEPLFDDEIFYAEIKEISNDKKTTTIAAKGFSYKQERDVLNKVIDKLFKKNSEKFNNREEIFELFARGMMTGNIMPIGRLIEGSFGKGTFRKIGELDNDIEAQEKFVNSL